MTTFKSRDNHYVPEWYQRGFLGEKPELEYLNLAPDVVQLKDGREVTKHSCRRRPPSKCFVQRDLYTTFFGSVVNDGIERHLFRLVDQVGSHAVWAFLGDNQSAWHKNFRSFFEYIDTQKIRTPKGLSWLRTHYPDLTQQELMVEMLAIRNMNCTIWTEGVREIVSAKKSNIKFIISDHPVTIYNHACCPDEGEFGGANDPPISWKASQTIYPLDKDNCLVLTNYEYASDFEIGDPKSNRTNARNFRNSLVRTDAFIKSRDLTEYEVNSINYVIKRRALRYVAASNKEWLFPEKNISSHEWRSFRAIFFPPKNGLFHFGGETYVGYEDGTSSYQDAFGRTTASNPYLKKEPAVEMGPNDRCSCGSGKKFKKCCRDKEPERRPTGGVLSIRERNLVLSNGIAKILGFADGNSWQDVRRTLSDEQIKDIYELYGSLWPPDTDIYALLPKTDNKVRALYTGMIDPRLISRFAIGLVPYFDEVLIQSPFVNPHCVRDKYNPIKNPHQYKQQTLFNVFLFLTLMPFIDEGIINLFPDPCNFDHHLQMQMFNMAESRLGKIEIDEDEKKIFSSLHEEDFKRSFFAFNREQQILKIKKVYPDISDGDLKEVLGYIQQVREEDQFALLQDDIFRRGGQFLARSMTPNFEMALFIAQVTGSIIFTDSPFRWRELKSAQKSGASALNVWTDFTLQSGSISYPVNLLPDVSMELRKSGLLGKTRKALDSILLLAKHKQDPVIANDATSATLQTIRKELASIDNSLIRFSRKMSNPDEALQHFVSAKMEWLIPTNGIITNNVQRLLVSSGVTNYAKGVYAAMYASNS